MKSFDGREAHVARLLRKLFALGLGEAEIIALGRSICTSTLTDGRALTDIVADDNARTRLKRAQYAIRQLMAAGFIETDIAAMVGVSPGSICHIIEPGSCRAVSVKLLAKLEKALRTSGWERLKTLIPYIPISVLDTCNHQGTQLTDATLAQIEDGLPRYFLRALLPGGEPMPAPDGIQGVLARVGHPRHETYLLKLWSPVDAGKEAEISHLQLLEHELNHVVSRIRERRLRLEKKSGVKTSPDRTEGKIA